MEIFFLWGRPCPLNFDDGWLVEFCWGDWFIEYFLAWIIQQSYWLVCWIIFVSWGCFDFWWLLVAMVFVIVLVDWLFIGFWFCLGCSDLFVLFGWLISYWFMGMLWLLWFCLCDVMGVGCFEMLSVCLRLWRMGRWARAILTYIYIYKTEGMGR